MTIITDGFHRYGYTRKTGDLFDIFEEVDNGQSVVVWEDIPLSVIVGAFIDLENHSEPYRPYSKKECK